jgi:hypothetical protein
MTKIAGSGSICQRHGSPDPDLDSYQNVMIRNAAPNTTLIIYGLEECIQGSLHENKAY